MTRKTVLETFGGRLQTLRLARGLSQTDVADMIGVKQPAISKMERGESQETAAIARLAASLKCSPQWLESGEGPEPNWGNAERAGGSMSELVAPGYTSKTPTRVAVISANLAHPEADVLLRMVRAAKLPGVTVEVKEWMEPSEAQAKRPLPGRAAGDAPAPTSVEPASLKLVRGKDQKGKAK